MMRLFKIITLLAVILNISQYGYSAANVYLLSEVEINRINLLVSDICKIEADRRDNLLGLVIPESLYSDGVVDREELHSFLNGRIDGTVSIYGSGVRVTKKIIPAVVVTPEKPLLVKKGETVELTGKKNGITVEIKGKALEKGSVDDEIEFRLSTGKVVKGRVTSIRKAELNL